MMLVSQKELEVPVRGRRMNLKGYMKEYHIFSGKLSDNTRKLAFAGIGTVWVFKRGENEASILPDMLKLAMLMFVIALLLDILQYAYQTAVWGIFYRYHEKKSCKDDELTAPIYFNWPSLFFLISKVITAVVGYVFVIRFLL